MTLILLWHVLMHFHLIHIDFYRDLSTYGIDIGTPHHYAFLDYVRGHVVINWESAP